MKHPIAKLFTITALLGAPTAALADVVRVLPSGAPACGNVMGKGPMKERACTPEEVKVWTAERAAARTQEAKTASKPKPKARVAARPTSKATR